MSDNVRDNGKPVAVSAALAEAASELSTPKNGAQSNYYLKSAGSINAGLDAKDGTLKFGATKEFSTLSADSANNKANTLAVLSRNSSEGLRIASSSPFRMAEPAPQISFSGNPTLNFLPREQPALLRNSEPMRTQPVNRVEPIRIEPSVVTRLRDAQQGASKGIDFSRPNVTSKNDITTKQILNEREVALAENRKQLEPKNPKHYINTAEDMKKMTDLAKKLGVPLVVEFGYPGCGFCGQMDKQTNPQFARNNKQALIAHVNVQEAISNNGRKDGGASIISQLKVPFDRGRGVPQTFVLAPRASDGALVQPQMPHVGFMPYDQLKRYVPNALPPDVVLRLRGQK